MGKIIEQKKTKRHKKLFSLLFLSAFTILLFSFFFIKYVHNPRVLALMSIRRHMFTQSRQRSQSSFFYGVNVEMSQILPDTPQYIVNNKGEDLIDIAARLGINLFRITNSTNNTIYTKAQWSIVLNKMRQNGIKALILIESPTIHAKNIPSEYSQFVQDYAINSGVLSDPDVYAVDVYNEPAINDYNVSLMKSASEAIKKNYPQTKVTVGWWAIDTFQTDQNGREIYKWDNYAAGKELDSFIDFYSIHMYGFDQQTFGLYPDPYVYTQNFISQVKNDLQTTKPLLIEEFGAANGEAVSDQETLGSSQLQANTYVGVYQSLVDMKDPQLTGIASFQFHARSNTPDAWAITKNHGNYLFPAAYVLQKYATGTSDIPLTLPFTFVPNDYLFTNADDGKTVTVNINDVVAFSLPLVPSYTYTVAKSGDAIFTTTENLTYASDPKKYYAVFHATGLGKAQFTVTQSNDTAKQVFFLTIIVQ